MLKVRKRDGYIEDFKPDKIIATCLKAGGSYNACLKIANEIEKKFHGIVDSKDILSYTIKRLKQLGQLEASFLYPLKEALYSLDGKEFEWYAAKLLELEGYDVRKEDNMIIRGKCIEHEIDIIAEKGGVTYVVECKHHDDIRILTDITATLKHYARFLDVKHNFKNPRAMLITNTKFTPPSIRFARCRDMILIGWNFPKNNGINAIIERHKAYPLTLVKIPRFYRNILMQMGIYTTLDLAEKFRLAEEHIPAKYLEKARNFIETIY